jgi:hypothetical protein
VRVVHPNEVFVPLQCVCIIADVMFLRPWLLCRVRGVCYRLRPAVCSHPPREGRLAAFPPPTAPKASTGTVQAAQAAQAAHVVSAPNNRLQACTAVPLSRLQAFCFVLFCFVLFWELWPQPRSVAATRRHLTHPETPTRCFRSLLRTPVLLLSPTSPQPQLQDWALAHHGAE